MTAVLIVDYLGEGTHAGRPASPSIPTGGIAIYYETDTGSTFVWNTTGAAWVQIASAGGGVTSVATGNGLTGGPITTSGTISAAITLASKTTTYTVLSGDSPTHFDNIGAAGTVAFDLPAAAAGLFYTFLVSAAHTVNVVANGTDQIAIGQNNSTAGGNVSASTPFASISIEAHGTGQWVTTSVVGTWTVN